MQFSRLPLGPLSKWIDDTVEASINVSHLKRNYIVHKYEDGKELHELFKKLQFYIPGWFKYDFVTTKLNEEISKVVPNAENMPAVVANALADFQAISLVSE